MRGEILRRKSSDGEEGEKGGLIVMFRFLSLEDLGLDLPVGLSVYFASSCGTEGRKVSGCYFVCVERAGEWNGMQYQSAGGTLVCALAGDLEGDIVGGVALDLESGCRQVVEVLVEQLGKENN